MSELQAFGQLDEQIPLQQSAFVPDEAQSESPVHDLGQAAAGRQRAVLVRVGSSLPALAQQTSPAAWSH